MLVLLIATALQCKSRSQSGTEAYEFDFGTGFVSTLTAVRLGDLHVRYVEAETNGTRYVLELPVST